MQKLLVVQWFSGQKNGGSSQRPYVQFLMNASIPLFTYLLHKMFVTFVWVLVESLECKKENFLLQCNILILVYK